MSRKCRLRPRILSPPIDFPGQAGLNYPPIMLSLRSFASLCLVLAGILGPSTPLNAQFLTPAPRARMEPLGQSSRLTSLVLSEIMYHPAPRADGKRLEFIELF